MFLMMTLEKAIERVSRWLDKGKQHEDSQLGYVEGWFTREDEQAFLMATNALMAEPCEDCISRQAALATFGLSDKTRKYGGDHSGYDTIMLYEVQDALEALPSVTPKSKTGHWTKEETIYGWDKKSYQCSCCGRSIHLDTVMESLDDYPYCHCGAEMEME